MRTHDCGIFGRTERFLASVSIFGGQTKSRRVTRGTSIGRFTRDKLRTPLSIAFACVATHNHFVLDRGGKVFNRTAPVIKLPPDATEDDHLALLGLLNSSTACFWMKQVFHNKGGTVESGRCATDDEAGRHFASSTAPVCSKFPLPADRPLELARQLDSLASLDATIPRRSPVSLDAGGLRRAASRGRDGRVPNGPFVDRR